MTTEATTPDTIVLIHGFWVTPRSWEDWKARYESRGYRVLTPAYPGFDVEVEALNADPTPIENLTVPAVIEHLESVVRELETPPILMGALRRWRLHPASHGSRLRRGRRSDQFRSHGGGQAGAALASQVNVPGAQESGEPPQGGRVHVQAVALRLHEHLRPGGGAQTVRALPHPRLPPGLLGQRAREHPPWPRRHLRQLQEPRPGPPPRKYRLGWAQQHVATSGPRCPRSRARTGFAPGREGGRLQAPETARRLDSDYDAQIISAVHVGPALGGFSGARSTSSST
jgi:hypothetical protein